jgi:hypothetical protein
MNKPYNNFDLPTRHLNNNHYVPERARASEEIERRHRLPHGTILAEHQRDGLAIASRIMQSVEQPEDLAFAGNVIAMSSLNAGWYNYAANSSVMRRRLLLPTLASEESDWRETKTGLLTKAQQGLATSAVLAEVLVATKVENRSTARAQQQLGRQLGNTSLQLACIEVGTIAGSYSAFDVQDIARTESLQLLEQARVLGDQVGSHPSIAQLADQDSDLAVYWRRQAPNGAYQAYEAAIADRPTT